MTAHQLGEITLSISSAILLCVVFAANLSEF